MIAGTIISIDRDNALCRVLTNDSQQPVPARYLRTHPDDVGPPPMVPCWLEPPNMGDSHYLCHRADGDGKVLFHDDFLHAPQGDKRWVLNPNQPGGTAGQGIGWLNQSGVCQLNGTSTSVEVGKDSGGLNYPTGTVGYWMATRQLITPLSVAGDSTVMAGFNCIDVGFINSAGFGSTTKYSASYYAVGGAHQSVFQNSNARDGVFANFDILWTADWAGMWCNGDGPYFTPKLDVPFGNQMRMFASGSAGVPNVFGLWDFIHLEQLSGVVPSWSIGNAK